jgi:glycosyltransferase involved in cell wall biosynthesis
MSMPPEVSVVIPCYNAEPFVGEAIESVLGQTHDSIELIVVDDGSTDRSLEVIRSFGDDVQVIAQENHGACHARNRGAEAAEGAYLMFLDADDVIGPTTIQALRDAIGERNEALARCPWKRLVATSNGWERRPSGKSADPPEDDPILGWLRGWFVPPCGLLWTREAFRTAGDWDEQLTRNQDGDLVLRALTQGVPLLKSEEGRALYRQHGPERTSISSNTSDDALHSQARFLRKVTERLRTQGRLDPYRRVLGRRYYTLARRLALSDVEASKTYERRARDLAGAAAVTGTFVHRWMDEVLGLQTKEHVLRALRS